MKPINVIILEGKPSTMLGIKSIVENQSDMQLIAYCNNEKEFTDTIKDINTDIAIVDVNLVRDILNLAPESRADYAYSISRDSNSSAQSITYTNQDNSKVDYQTNLELSHFCLDVLTDKIKQSSHQPLTDIEIEVLKFVAVGYSNQQIANINGKTLSTVRSQIASIFSKFSAKNRVQAIAKGIKFEYLKLSDLDIIEAK